MAKESATNPDFSLSERVIKSSGWVFLFSILKRVLSVVKLIIVARVLSPYDFGLLGIALVMIATFETLSEPGFKQALIHKKNDIRDYLNTAWSVLIIKSLVLFAILFFTAPLAADFFDVPEAKLVIQVIAFAVILNSASNIGLIYYKKDLEFNKEFIYQFSGTAVEFITTIILAFKLKNVWALALGYLAGHFTKFITSYFLHSFRPRFDFDLTKIKELFRFGKWVLGSSFIIFLITQGDDIFVGKLLGAMALGFYQMAYRISNLPVTEISHIVTQVTFPAYSKAQSNIDKLRKGYLKAFKVVCFLSFPLCGIIFMMSSDITRVLLGQKWMPMVQAMQVLVFWGALRSIGATTGPIFYAVGKPKTLAKIQFYNLILLVLLIYPFSIQFGIVGTSLAVVIATLLPLSAAFYQVTKIIKCTGSHIINQLAVPFISTAIMCLSIFLLSGNVFSEMGIIKLVLAIFCAGLVYLLSILFVDKFFDNQTKLIIKESIAKIFKGHNE